MHYDDFVCEFCPQKFPATKDGILEMTWHIIASHPASMVNRPDACPASKVNTGIVIATESASVGVNIIGDSR